MSLDSGVPTGRPNHTRTQHAIRLLVLLDRAGDEVVDGDPPTAVKAVGSCAYVGLTAMMLGTKGAFWAPCKHLGPPCKTLVL